MTTIKLKKAEPDYIDMTPSFEQATRMAILVLHRGTPEGQRMAEEELLRYARELDRLKGGQ